MARYERVVDVDASPAIVWAVMTDIERWPEWTPSMRKIIKEGDGAFGLGSTARVTAEGRPEGVWRVTDYAAERSFTWETGAGPGLRVQAVHAIEPAGSGSRVTLTIAAAGPAAMLAGWLVARMSKRNVDLEADGLKRRAEERSGKVTDA